MTYYILAFLLLFNQQIVPVRHSSSPADSQPEPKKKSGPANVVFKSVDGGQTWQDISKGLPDYIVPDLVERHGFFATDHGLFLRAGDWVYQCKPNSTASDWEKVIFLYPDRQAIAPGKDGIY